MSAPKEVHRYVLGVHAFEKRGRFGAWLVYCVTYADGAVKTEKGPLLTDVEAAKMGILGDVKHAALAHATLETFMSARDDRLRNRRNR